MEKDNNLVMNKIKNSFLMRKNTVMSKDSDNLHKSLIKLKDYQILNNPNLQRFEAMYIPTLPSSMRKSACHIQSTDNLFMFDHQPKLRWSSGADDTFKKAESNIKEVEE